MLRVRGRIVLGNGVRIGAHSSLLGFNHGFSPARPRPNCPVPSTPSGCVPCRIPPPDWSPSTPPTEVLEHRPPRHPTVGPTTAPPGITCCRWAVPWICSARASPHSRLLRPVRRASSVRRADGGHRDGPRPGSALVRPRARERLRCARRGSPVVARGATEPPPCRRCPRLGGGTADTGLDRRRDGADFGPAGEGSGGPGREPGLQGPEMWLAIIWLSAGIVGLADRLGYRPRGVHRPEPGPSMELSLPSRVASAGRR